MPAGFGEVALRYEPLEVDQAAAHYHQALALAEELVLHPLQDVLPPGARHSLCQTGQRQQAQAALSATIGLYVPWR